MIVKERESKVWLCIQTFALAFDSKARQSKAIDNEYGVLEKRTIEKHFFEKNCIKGNPAKTRILCPTHLSHTVSDNSCKQNSKMETHKKTTPSMLVAWLVAVLHMDADNLAFFSTFVYQYSHYCNYYYFCRCYNYHYTTITTTTTNL